MEKLYLPNNKELTMESQEKHNIEWKSVWKDEYLVGLSGKIFLTNTINHFMTIHNQHHFLMGYFDKIYKIIIP